jgi:hypothetical protein
MVNIGLRGKSLVRQALVFLFFLVVCSSICLTGFAMLEEP